MIALSTLSAIVFFFVYPSLKYKEEHDIVEKDEEAVDLFLEDLLAQYEKLKHETATQEQTTGATKEETPPSNAQEASQEASQGTTEKAYQIDDFIGFDVDNAWYDIDAAKVVPPEMLGYIECVIEIPKINLRRNVYNGDSWAEIVNNLDAWQLTAASEQLTFGKTHYTIYGHNLPSQKVAFNRMDELVIGDTIIIISSKGRYEFIVSEITKKTALETQEEYVADMERERDLLTIATCGRKDFKDFNRCVIAKLSSYETIESFLERMIAERKTN